jgi:hypothetical protein
MDVVEEPAQMVFHGFYMDASRLPRTIRCVGTDIGCSFISGLSCRLAWPAGPDGNPLTRASFLLRT